MTVDPRDFKKLDFKKSLGALPFAEAEGVRSTPPPQGDKQKPRTPEIHKTSSEINDLEHEPGHIWRLPVVSGFTRYVI